MPRPPHMDPGRNLYNKNGTASKANSAGTVSFDKIKCGICKVTKQTSEYAKRQQQKHADSIYNAYAPRGRSTKVYATCKECTAKQVNELTCVVCNDTKDIKYFNKTQRHDPDKARCRKCVQVNEDRKPGIDQDTVHSDDYFEDTSSEDDIDASDDENMFTKVLPPMPKAQNAPKNNDSSESEGDLDAPQSEEKKKVAPLKKNGGISKKTPLVPASGAASPAAASTRSVGSVRSKTTSPNVSTSGVTSPGSTAFTSGDSIGSPQVNSGSNDEWQTVPNNRTSRKGNAFSSSRGSAWNSGAQTPSLYSTKKGGWAKPPKLKNDEVPPFFLGTDTPGSGARTPIPAHLPTGGQPSMVKKRPNTERKKKIMEEDSDDEYNV